MVRAAKDDPAGEQADAHVSGQSLPDLSGIVHTGATHGVVRVRKAVLYLEDGRRLVLELPAAAPPAKDWTKTKTGRAILDVMASEGRGLKAATIAKLIGGEYSGSFRQALKGLVDQGEVVQTDDGYEIP